MFFTVKANEMARVVWVLRRFPKATARPPRGAVVALRRGRNTYGVRGRHEKVNSVADGRGKTHKWGFFLNALLFVYLNRLPLFF